MNRFSSYNLLFFIGLALIVPGSALADHQWGKYHWERKSVEPLQLTVGDAHTPSPHNDWSVMLDDVIAGWDLFSGDHLGIIESTPDTSGILSYNGDYGDTGWLGLASIWVKRGRNAHITAGESRMNEFYVTLAGYDGFNEPIEWQHVLCQEIGHTFGLDHNREGATGGTPDDTCMNDETRPLRYPSPNIHDTEQLNIMYQEVHGDGGGGGGPKCHPVFGCPGAAQAAVAHAIWAEQYDSEADMFAAADLVVTGTVLGSAHVGSAGPAHAPVPVTQVLFRVDEAVKGEARGVITLTQTRGPGLEIADDPGYVGGDTYTLYLRRTGPGTYRTVNPMGRIRH